MNIYLILAWKQLGEQALWTADIMLEGHGTITTIMNDDPHLTAYVTESYCACLDHWNGFLDSWTEEVSVLFIQKSAKMSVVKKTIRTVKRISKFVPYGN